jgi:hypothetical protein
MVQEHPSRIGRRLSAIVSADIAGYSRLMGSTKPASPALCANTAPSPMHWWQSMAAVSSRLRETVCCLSFARRAAGTFFV